MPTPELLSLLCAGTVKFHQATGSHGAALLTRAEIAGLLKGLPADATDLALAKYAGDIDAERKLIAKTRTWAAGLAVKEFWPIVRGRPTLCNLCALAVLEVVRPGRCGTCHGTGFKGVRLCPTCAGGGFKALKASEIADGAGLTYHDFSRHWRPRYESIFLHVSALDGQVNAAVNRNNFLALDTL